MCRFLAAIVAIVLFVVSTFAGVFSLFSMDWYNGEAYGTPINIGVQSGCTEFDEVSIGSLDLNFCRDINWSSLKSASEEAMAIMLIIASAFGVLAIIFLLIALICLCTCLSKWLPGISSFGLMQCLLLIATSMTMAAYYDWRSPTNTHIGTGFIILLVGIGCSFFGVCLTALHIYRKPESLDLP